MRFSFRVGVEWVDKYSLGSHQCPRPADISFAGHVTWSFLSAMGSYGHDRVFNWGNGNAWSSDFEHPDFGGDSLNWSDNVHFCYFLGHGNNMGFEDKRVQVLGFSSNRSQPNFPPCFTMSAQWRLGVKHLKWFVIDSCVMVKNTDPSHILEVWGPPMQGVHLLFGFIDVQRGGPNTYNQRMSFAFDICKGRALANAWLATAYRWDHPKDPVNRPIAIAAGATRDEALNRREYEILDWGVFDVAATRWLAWKWRG